MGDSMVIKTDEIKAEMVNYNKTEYDNNSQGFLRENTAKKSYREIIKSWCFCL